MSSNAQRVQRRLDVAVEGQKLNPLGEAITFENDLFVGSLFFTHRSPHGGSPSCCFPHFLDAGGESPPLWELQIQGRFKRQPESDVFIGLELERKTEMGFVTRALAGAVLTFFNMVAHSKGTEVKASFGSDTERPLFAVPLMKLDRIYVHDEPVQLPILGDERQGCFSMDADGAILAELDRTEARPRTDCYMTWLLASPRVDWFRWEVISQSLGSMNLEQFWGEQPCFVSVFDSPTPQERRRMLSMRLHAPLVDRALEAPAFIESSTDLGGLSEPGATSLAEPFRLKRLDPAEVFKASPISLSTASPRSPSEASAEDVFESPLHH
jgi:hypothetical protein